MWYVVVSHKAWIEVKFIVMELQIAEKDDDEQETHNERQTCLRSEEESHKKSFHLSFHIIVSFRNGEHELLRRVISHSLHRISSIFLHHDSFWNISKIASKRCESIKLKIVVKWTLNVKRRKKILQFLNFTENKNLFKIKLSGEIFQPSISNFIVSIME